MGAIGTKIMAIYLMISVFLLFTGVVNPVEDFMSNFVHIEANPNNMWTGNATKVGNISERMGITDEVNKIQITGDTNYVLESWNPVFIVWEGIKLIGKFVFCPVVYLQAIGAPFPFVLAFGVVPAVLFMVSLIAWIKGNLL